MATEKALEARARRAASRLGYRATKTRWRAGSCDNQGGFAIVDDTSEAQLLDLLDEALAARVIEELPTSAGDYQFTHALIQETYIRELSAARRVRMHARIAEALEKLYAEDADEHATELAPHFAEAEPVLGTDRLFHYSKIAGDRALAGD